jgi:hypothetical protein
MAGRHPRFQFEAKRLHGKGNPAVTAYLGDEGLGCFLSGTYAQEWDEAGMLGYVQAGDPSKWASRIENRVRDNRGVLHVTTDGNWVLHQIIPELHTTYRTFHNRPTLQRSITIYHTLLDFRP